MPCCNLQPGLWYSRNSYIGAVGAYGTAPGTIQAGCSPKQPVPFSHKLYASALKMDCRHCHNTVDQAAHAAIPPTATCVNCHTIFAVTCAGIFPAIHVGRVWFASSAGARPDKMRNFKAPCPLPPAP